MFDATRRMRGNSRARQGMAAAERAVTEALKRKEEYLGARVPKELREKVLRQAHELGIPVSILIRKVLEEAFTGNEKKGGGMGVVQAIAKASGAERYPAVLGWEEISLNKPINCSDCGKSLSAGMKATLGFVAPGEKHVILCHSCRRHL